jgi:hypothetical protein
MATIRTIIATVCLLAAAGLLTANVTKAQTVPDKLPVIPVPQAVPSPEQLKEYSAPAMSLADIPPTPAEAAGKVPRLTVTRPGGVAHIMPTVAVAAARNAAALKQGSLSGLGPLLYHGGPVMNPYPLIYTIFWGPSRLQNGGATGYSSKYVTLEVYLSAYLAGHAIQNIATQYYQTVGSTTTFIQNGGGLAGFYYDTAPFPASGCADSFTPGNCISDAQIQAEIARVMKINGWTGGINKIFLLFTSSGEGSCFNSTSTSCAYVQYCAYHSFFGPASMPVIYGNEPFANTSVCKTPSQTSPNGDVGDLAASTASHELMEAITDPLLNAWFDSAGNEIGDLCNFVFGAANPWVGPSAMGNQMWNGFVYELQQEYDNSSGACASAGPQ